jgi:hypothetical protein
VLFVLGAGRFVLRHRFGFIDALHCYLTVVPAALLLLVFDYVLHHARLVSIILFILAGTLAFSSPAFDVALGLALMGVIAGPTLSDLKNENRLWKSTKAYGCGNKKRK